MIHSQEQASAISSDPPKQVNRQDEVIPEEESATLNEQEQLQPEEPETGKVKGFKEGLKDDSTIEPEEVDSDDQPAFPEEEG